MANRTMAMAVAAVTGALLLSGCVESAAQKKEREESEAAARELTAKLELELSRSEDLEQKVNTLDRQLSSRVQTLKDLASTLRRQEIEIKEVKDDLLKAKETAVGHEVLIDKQRKELDRRHKQINEMHKVITDHKRAEGVIEGLKRSNEAHTKVLEKIGAELKLLREDVTAIKAAAAKP